MQVIVNTIYTQINRDCPSPQTVSTAAFTAKDLAAHELRGVTKSEDTFTIQHVVPASHVVER